MKVGNFSISRFNEGLTVFKPDYYLNEGKKIISDLLDKGIENTTLAEIAGKLYQGGIFKRVFNQEGEKAYKYITASDMVKIQPLDSAKNISKKFTPWVEEMTLKPNQILVSCAGTVGNTVLVDESYSGCIGSQEIIRIENTSVPFGYLYAYLSTPLVYKYIQSMIYGAVVPRISPDEIGRLPILLSNKLNQKKIHNLIVEASKLRIESNKLLKEAIATFESKIGKSNVHLGYQTGKIKASFLNSFHKRLDSQFQLLWKDLDSEKIESIQYDKIYDYATNIFVGGRGKRNYVENGVAFLSSSEMILFNPKRGCKYVSKNNPGLASMIVSKKDILISRSGTVGNTVLVGEDLDGTAISEHALRLIIDSEKISPNYVFCFLKTKYGMKSMEASSFGSVIITLNEDLIGNIQLPIIDQKSQDKINDLIETYLVKMDEATEKDNEAINLVEKEIESWQK